MDDAREAVEPSAACTCTTLLRTSAWLPPGASIVRPLPSAKTRTASEPVRCQHIDRRTGPRVAVSDAVGAREHLTEGCVDKCLMNSGEACRFHSQVDDDVDIIRGSRVERSSFDLEQKDHLSTDQLAMATERWCQLDEGAPRRLLSTGERWKSNRPSSDIGNETLGCNPVPWIS